MYLGQVRSMPTYDWRELTRWGISESRLPPGSVVLFRQPTAWQRYRRHVIAAAAGLSVVFHAVPPLYTAVKLVRAYRTHEDEHPEDNAVVVLARRHLRVGERYDGMRLWYRENGVRVVSPMVIVIIALGATDIMFALDSIPAIFGITEEPYLVFTANVFALMGLRQLYFLLGGLLDRLIYLSLGLAFILAFIGVKLIFHAMHENELPFINGGEHITLIPEIPTWLSLIVIAATITVAAVFSLRHTARQEAKAEAANGHIVDPEKRGAPPETV